MKSYRILKKEAELKLKIKKKENAQDTISKSLKIIYKPLNISIMKTLRNKVQLIGNVGDTPKAHTFESGKKVIRFSLATNDYYLKDGEKVQQTQWHNVVAWGKQADIIEKYVFKGSEIAIDGKLTSRSFENEGGEKQYISEVLINEILLLDSKGSEKETN